MVLLDISLQSRVIIGISAMVVLFTGFLVVFISNQRKKILYHKNMQAMHEEQQQLLRQQNILLEQKVKERTAEISAQKETLQKTLEDLKASQLQLIQKEKMASMGELTAGIAHEIQNPLNFVLNFGDINAELLEEIKEKMAAEETKTKWTGDISELVNDISDNQKKILHHGRRAEGIVKNMLQHTRRSDGIMELAEINELADEYLKLSYHGFRSKHKSFHCTFKNSFDSEADRLRIIPQDIGHLLVILFNNAFYAMNEKQKKYGSDYNPVMQLSTKRKENKLFLKIEDNGTGIPAKNIQKIFQPFFTTKPTGEATGLGLSLGYDIVKAHQGELKVESNEGERTLFTIELNY
jgi:two-component system, NtrC family, sensor kinase